MTNRQRYIQAFSPLHASSAELAESVKSVRRRRVRATRTVLIAAVLSVLFIAAAFAASPSIFAAARELIASDRGGSCSPEYEKVRDEIAAQQEERRELYERAEQANAGAEAIYIPLPEFDGAGITISERYYDGERFLIGLGLNEACPELTFGYGPGCEHFDELMQAFVYTGDGDDSFEHYLEIGAMTQAEYDETLSRLESEGKEYLRHESNVLMDRKLMELAGDREYADFQARLRAEGAAGFVYREISVGDHIMLGDGADAGPNGQQETEYGICIESGVLPEQACGLDELSVVLRVKAYKVFCYMDLEKGALMRYVPDGEIPVEVTLSKSQ